MKIGITYRLFLAILLAAALAVASMVIITQWSLYRGFLRYVNTIEKTGLSRLAGKLEEAYAGERGWDNLRHDQTRWRRLVMASLPEEVPGPADMEPPDGSVQNRSGDNRPLPPRKPLPPHLAGSFIQRLFLLDDGKNPVVSHARIPSDIETRPLLYQGKTVGYLGLLPHNRLSDEHQLRFLKEQKNALALVAVVLVGLAAGLSLILANRLIRPIKALAAATHDLASGRYDIRVPVASSDELGRLARDFNTLALTLEKNEQARRQWVADISHELRTPLAVLRGEIEAIQDGIRRPDADSIRSLHCEALRLGRLVEDLYQLSLADLGALTYRKEELDLAELLDDSLAAFGSKFAAKEITLVTEVPEQGACNIFGDQERLHQLCANLLDNALKYTDAGGMLAVRLACKEGSAVLDLQDSAPGVAESDLERLFDRLFRVEGSRNRIAGGAGLGLAICRGIAEAHAGTITARSSALGGLWIRVMLPLMENRR